MRWRRRLDEWLQRIGCRPPAPVSAGPPPPVLETPEAALERHREGGEAAFFCPVEHCVIFNGLSMAVGGWHPFVQTVREHLITGQDGYAGSILERYYQGWQPSNALEALIGATAGPAELTRYPAHLMHAPWLRDGPEERLRSMERIMREEGREHGGVRLKASEGHGFQGPVSARKGELEYQRLRRVLKSIQSQGYDRQYGDVHVQVLRRGNDHRFRIVHGHHRVAVMSALGHEAFVAVPRFVVCREEVASWPWVQRGPWTVNSALRYFDHHFDFDSLAWARARGLPVLDPASAGG